ncbi:Alpha/Beta hydrolase protein [Mucidula mucida]|nr:Alpha/Beta hydrolase protein [Mucidula mucida]
MPYSIIQRVVGETLPVYNDWAKGESCIEPIPDIAGANLLWIGEKKTECVILYVHGGGYGMPYLAGALPFWRYVKDKVTERVRSDRIGMAVFSYSLIPEGIFPTPFKQLIQAIVYLVESGTPPSNIYLVGDSAGANLILQLLAHSLQPIPDVPRSVSPDTKFGGIYLMSPWVDPLGDTFTPSMPHATEDIFYPDAYKMFGTIALIGVPPAQRMYMQMIEFPEGFFRDLKQNMLVSYAGRETLRDSIKLFYERHLQGKENVSLAFDKDGIHDDPYANFNMFGARPKGELTAAIIDWLAKSLSASHRLG